MNRLETVAEACMLLNYTSKQARIHNVREQHICVLIVNYSLLGSVVLQHDF